jgi:hypothetical protein
MVLINSIDGIRNGGINIYRLTGVIRSRRVNLEEERLVENHYQRGIFRENWNNIVPGACQRLGNVYTSFSFSGEIAHKLLNI